MAIESCAAWRISSPSPPVRSVSTKPGATTLTVIARLATSLASDFENPIIPAFEAA